MPATSSEHTDPDPRPAPATLRALPGLGPKSEAMLRTAGIGSPDELRRLGAARAFVQVQAAGLRPSLNLLWALEGALTATPWRHVAHTERTRLLLEVDELRSHAGLRRG